MKRFQFPLDRVLRYRHLQAEAEEAKLQAQLTRLRQLEERLELIDREGARTEEAVRQSLVPPHEVRSEDMVTYPNYRSVLARGKRGLEQERQRRLAEIERQRANVLEAYRAREILERARKQALDHWRAEYTKEQDAMAGELYLTQWRRRVR
jgi:flagellar export protein FliJ